MTLDWTRIDKHFTPSEQEMKVSLLNGLVMTFNLGKIYISYNFFYTCNTVEVDFEFGYQLDYRKRHLR